MSRQVLRLQDPNSGPRSRSRSNSPTKLFQSVTPSRTRSQSNAPCLTVSPTKDVFMPSSTLEQTNASELLRSVHNETRRRSPSFTIYQDDHYYRDSLQYTQNETAPIEDSDKENVGPTLKKEVIQPKVLSSQRSPLTDLSIYQFPGFIDLHSDDSSHSTVLRPKKPLTTTWIISTENKSKKLYIPSFITPPKKNRVIKYVSTLNHKHKHKGPKRLDFADDCRDMNALVPKPISLHYDNF